MELVWRNNPGAAVAGAGGARRAKRAPRRAGAGSGYGPMHALQPAHHVVRSGFSRLQSRGAAYLPWGCSGRRKV